MNIGHVFAGKIFFKFQISEKHTKIKKNHYYINKCPKHEEDYANFCMLLRKSELYTKGQLISKWLYGVIVSTKKTTKSF